MKPPERTRVPKPHPAAHSEFWENLYETREDGWELGRPSPPLKRILRTDPPPTGRVAVLGCGRGHDAREFARRGYRVIGYDFAKPAITAARKLGGARFEQADIFQLPRKNQFDVVWEYTCFCAIPPTRRREYADLIRGLLRPGGTFLALFYPLSRKKSGPPFAVKRSEIRSLFREGFEWVSEERPTDSVERRRGKEWLVRLKRSP